MGSELRRPEALTPERQQSIIDLLARGNYLSTACEASGLTYNGFLHWRQRWEKGDPAAKVYDNFFRSVERAISVGETSALDRVKDGGPGWQGSAWFLERRHHKRWGKKETVEIVSKTDLSKLSDEELADIASGKGVRRTRT